MDSLSRNTLINLGGYVIPTVVALVTVPLYLHSIGQARYGVLAIVWILLGYFGAFDMGLGRAAANQLARLRAARPEQKAPIYWTALSTNLTFGICGGAILFLLGHFALVDLIKTPGTLRPELSDAWPIVALGVPLATVSGVLSGALESHERFLMVNLFGVGGTVLSQVLPLLVAWTISPTLPWLVGTASVVSVLSVAGLSLVSLRVLGISRTPRIERARLGELFRYGGWITLTGLLTPVLTTVDRLVIGARAGAVAVTHYTVPFNLVARIQLLPMSVTRTLFPRLSLLKPAQAAAIADSAVTALLVTTTPLTVVAMVSLEPFLKLWLGADLGRATAPVGEILLVGMWCNNLAHVPYIFLQAQGRPDVPAKFHLYEVLPYLGILWLGLAVAKVSGAAFAWDLRVLVDAILLFWAARLPLHRRSGVLTAAILVLVSYVGAATVFHEPIWRITIGSLLIGIALWWGWHEAPESFRAFVRRLPNMWAPRSAT